MKLLVEISLGQASEAFWEINDCRQIKDRLQQEASDIYKSKQDFDLFDEDSEEEHYQLSDDIKDLFARAGVTEYSITLGF